MTVVESVTANKQMLERGIYEYVSRMGTRPGEKPKIYVGSRTLETIREGGRTYSDALAAVADKFGAEAAASLDAFTFEGKEPLPGVRAFVTDFLFCRD